MIQRRIGRSILIVSLAGIFVIGTAYGQGRGGRGGAPQGPPPTAKAAAPFDITGYWLSIVTEDWRYRMVSPPKNDFLGIPLNPAGRKVGEAWDPAKDEAA